MTRQMLKAQAKQMISKNYWYIIGCTLLVEAIFFGASSIVAPTGIGAFAVYFLSPISLGLMNYYVLLSDNRTVGVESIFSHAFDGKYYLRRVGGMAWMALFTFLWSLLFVIPGIVKSYSYALTPYILSQYPEIPAKEALKLSMKIMDGRKMEYFVLHLSFLGWILLTALTAGLLGIFFVIPYMYITQTLYMKNVMKEVTDSGEFFYSPVIEM